MSERAQGEPIAILGVGLRLPGAGTVPEFWDLLASGRDLVGPVPADRWDPVAWGTPAHGAFLTEPYRFDASFFGISPREAADMDPAQRLLLEVAWEALDQAGRAPDRLTGTRTGVWVGLALSDWSRRHFGGSDPSRLGPHSGTGSLLSVAAGRVSYLLGLRGPAMTVDTACSSSLVALHLAVASLRRGEVDLALAGGASMLFHPMPSLYFGQVGALSADGRCRTFDAAATGYGRGEGAGLFALARLSDAPATGMPILAVIRGTAVNHDGRTSGLTAPSGSAQQDVVRAALADAGAEPGEVVYVEAHGTGTPLGDPIELDALRAVFLPRPTPLHVGSVKTNLAHLETAAGVAGLLKAALVLRHGVVPPHLHLERPNPRLDLDGIQVSRVATAIGPGLAGVSGFGLSGTNAHVVIGPAPAPESPRAAEGPVVLTLSARTQTALRATAERWADALPEAAPSALASSAARRATLPHRAAVVGATPASLVAGLRALATAPAAPPAPRRPPTLAFLFAGQGAQRLGMGADLAAAEPSFRAHLERAAAAVDAASGERPLLELMRTDGEALADTRWTQPALWALQVALAAFWRERGVEPDLLVGHSIGELSAATVAGVFDLDAGARLAVARGRCLSALPRDGAMWAVLAPEAVVRERLAGAPVDVAAVNHPGETVLAGRRVDLDALKDALQGLEVRPLLVSHPFHSRWVEPALAPFEQALRNEVLSAPSIPVISAVDGAHLGARATEVSFWRDHIRAPVRFGAALQAAWDEGATVFVELSARAVLGGMVERTLPAQAVSIPTLRTPTPEPEAAARALAAAWVAGVPVTWPGGPGATDLPPTAFDLQHHFVPDPTVAPPASRTPGVAGAGTKGLLQWVEATTPWSAPSSAPASVLRHVVSATDPVEALAAFAAREGGPWWIVAPDTVAGAAVYGAALAVAAEAPDRVGGFVWSDGPAPATTLGHSGVLRVVGDQVVRVQLERIGASVAAPPLAGTVLVTGATGSLGPALLAWVAARGATRVVVVSRAGHPPAFSTPGLRIEGVAADLEAPESLAAIAQGIPDLVGVVHAAGVTDDAPFGTLDRARLERVLAVKVGATQVLDRVTRGRSLSLFAVVSSASAWVGTPGQAAYAAANRAAEWVVRSRIAAGEAGCAVALGPIAGTSLADVSPAVVARWEREGMPRTALADVGPALDRAAGSSSTVLAVPFDWERVREVRPLAPAPAAAPGPSRPVPARPPPPADLRGAVLQVVRTTLGYGPEVPLDPGAGLFDLGMDSVAALDLRRRLQELLGRPLSATVALDHPTVDRLVLHLAAEGAPLLPARSAPLASNDAIAIVGVSCRLPGGIDDPDALWDVLAAGAEVVGPVPATRFDPETLGSAPRRGGFVRELERFDASTFGMSAAEAVALDPQHRLLLEGTWGALQDAGVGPEATTGVWVAVEPGDYARRLSDTDPYAITGNQPSMASGRVSYVFGFEGPSVSVDTACSSGLVALAAAVRELRAGTVGRAIVGGVNAITAPDATRAMALLGALSPRGRCTPFDASADGYVRSEGCVVLVLERLDDAIREGRWVHGVIEGVAVGHDGGSAGLTVPNGPAQERVIRAALADAGRTPDDLDAVECHGTGTPLGDPIELGALGRVFAERSRPLWLGAAKASFGHLEAAAGLLGVLAALGRLRHGKVPPIAHYSVRNPQLPTASTLQWPASVTDVDVQRVGVSAFGITGTDAHVVLAQAPPVRAAADPGPWLLPLAARTEAQLRATAARLSARHPDGPPGPAIQATLVARPSAFGRFRSGVRVCGVATNQDEVRAWFAGVADGTVPLGPPPAPADPKLAAAVAAARAWVERGAPLPRPVGGARASFPTTVLSGERHWVPHPSVAAELVRWRVDPLPFTPALRGARPGPVEVVGALSAAAALQAGGAGPGVLLDLSALEPGGGDLVATAMQRVLAHATRLRSAVPGTVVILVTHGADRDPVQGALAALAVTAAVELADVAHHHVDLDRVPDRAWLELLLQLELPLGRSNVREGRWSRPVLVRDVVVTAPAAGSLAGPLLVAGASGALGTAVSAAAAAAGMAVYGIARTLPEGKPGLPIDLAKVDGADLRAAWAARGLPSPATVVHAAGAAADAALRDVSAELLEVSFGARVRGALALRAAFPEAVHLTIGSAAAVVGNPGQGAYAAAHGFLHTLAGGTVALGPVAGEGSAQGIDWSRRGVRPVPPSRVLEALQGGGVVLDLDWPQWAATVPRVPPLVRALVGSDAAAAGSAGIGLKDTIRRVVTEVLGRDVGLDQGFFDAGLDSIGVVAVARRLSQALGREVPPTTIFDHPTRERLGVALDTVVAPVQVQVASASAADGAVAIVGFALRLPGGVVDAGSLRQMLDRGQDTLGPTPPDRWDESADPELTGLRAGWLPGEQVRTFDPAAFGLSAREAQAMDPQHRLLLVLAHEAIEAAGLRPGALRGSRTAVFVGAGDSGYLDRFQRPGDPRYGDLHAGTGNLSAFASGRLSHVLGLQGPNLTLNTACSSSLVAVHLARRALLDGEATAALAGGVHLMLSPEHTRYLARMGALSKTGACHTFDVAADGYVRGEGAGLFVMMRLADAVAGGHPVLAVVRGSAMGHDGAASGLTVPSGPAQEDVIRRALADARAAPDDVDYVEAHGTGTPLGDPIEVEALHRVFGTRPASRPLRLGSVKTVVGHGELAAGVASLAKVVDLFGAARVPPHLHLTTPAPGLRLRERGYEVPTAAVPWAGKLVGISSFGLSGTNVHLVVSAGPSRPVESLSQEPGPPEPVGPVLLAWSAPSSGALAATARTLVASLDGGRSLAPLAHGMLAHREPRGHRAFVVAADAAEARVALAVAPRGTPPERGPVAFLFTGQGSQSPGMGLSLAARFPVVRATFDEARSILGDPLFDAWSDARVHHTRTTQPALLVLGVALARWWATLGVVPDVVLGHSVGHFAAAVTAGVLSFPDALRLVDARARLLAGLPDGVGAMLAVDASEAVVVAALVPGAVLAATNHPESCTVSGTVDAVERVAGNLAAKGVRTTRLSVSHAFHSPLVDPVLDAFTAEVARVTLHPAQVPVVSNLDGAVTPAAELTRPRWWAELLRAPVRFREGLATIGALEPALLLEVGPHAVLGGMARATLGAGPAVVATLRNGEEPVRSVLRAAGEVFVARGVDAAGLFSGPGSRDLPLTAFDAVPCWLEEPAPAEPWVRESWEAVDRATGPVVAAAVTGDGPVAAALRTAVAVGPLRVAVFERDEPATLTAALGVLQGGVDVVVTVGAATRPWLLAIHGLLRSLAAEEPRRAPRWLDVDGDVEPARVVAELSGPGSDLRISAVGVARRVLVPATLPPAAAPVVTIVTGGLSGVGHAVAVALLAAGAPALVLVGRSPPTDAVAEWLRGRPVEVVQGDVGDPAVVEAAAAAAERLADGGPIGVVHAAGALADRAFGSVTPADLATTTRSKVVGATLLDARLPGAAYFLAFGAGAAVLGTPGQAAYAAANAGLAAVVARRRSRGASGVVVDWGAWDEVGMAARLDATQQSRRRDRGLGSLSVASGTAIAMRALAATGQIAVLPTDWRRYVEVVHAGQPPPLLARLVPVAVAPTRVAAVEESAVRRLALVPAAGRTEAVTAWVHEVTCRVLRATELDDRRSLFEAGLDSLLAIELKNALMDGGVDVPVAVILSEPTVASIAAAVEARLPAVSASPSAPPESTEPPVPVVVSHGVAFALGVLFVILGYLGTAWLAGYQTGETPPEQVEGR